MTKTQNTNLNFFYIKICQEMFTNSSLYFYNTEMLLTVHFDVVTLLRDICCYSTDKDKG